MHLYAQLTPLGIDVFGIENSKAVLDFQVVKIILDRLLKFVKQYHLNVFQMVKIAFLKTNANIIWIKLVVWMELMDSAVGYQKIPLVNCSKYH